MRRRNAILLLTVLVACLTLERVRSTGAIHASSARVRADGLSRAAEPQGMSRRPAEIGSTQGDACEARRVRGYQVQEWPLLAEDCQLLAFSGSPQNAEWLGSV